MVPVGVVGMSYGKVSWLGHIVRHSAMALSRVTSHGLAFDVVAGLAGGAIGTVVGMVLAPKKSVIALAR